MSQFLKKDKIAVEIILFTSARIRFFLFNTLYREVGEVENQIED